MTSGKHPEVHALLEDFRQHLQEHLLTENLCLYVRLVRQLASDDAATDMLQEFRRDMLDVQRTLLDFLRNYESPVVTAETALRLKKDFEAIGSALMTRIEREEQVLYPLYTDD